VPPERLGTHPIFIPSRHSPRLVCTVCPYHERNGLFNPDGCLINRSSQLADAIIYNVISRVLTNYIPAYSPPTPNNAIHFIRT
jgi:hypothetical protein